MTMELLCRIIEENNIPRDVHFMSDSGSEISATEMDGVFYHREENTIVFTTGESYSNDHWYDEAKGWETLYYKCRPNNDEG